MKAILSFRGVWLATLAAIVTGAGIILAAAFDEKTDWEAVFDKDLYSYYMAQEVQSLDEIISDFEFEQAMYLPIAVPDPEFIHFQSGGILPFDPKNFPVAFCEGLVPVEEGAIVMYPITVYEDPKTRERVILNAKNEKIGGVYAPWDYDPQWYVKEQYATTLAMGGDYVDWLVAMYDPSRIVTTYKLILEDDLIKLVWQQSIEAAERAEEEGGGMMMLDWEGESVTNIQFVSIFRTNSYVAVKIAYPDDFTNRLDIFTCDGGTGLIDFWWELADTVDVSASTNWITWTDSESSSSNVTVRFYAAGNADINAVTDPDGDGLTWAREKYLYHTCPTNSDTDADGLSDYQEVIVLNTDPNNDDTNKPATSILFPANGFSWVWMP